jgi:hypothetical protein
LKNEILAVIVVLLVAGSLGVGYLAGSQLNVRTTTTTQSLTTQSASSASSTETDTCTVSAESTGFFLHLVSDSTNASIAGVQVTVTPVVECGQDTTESSLSSSYTTNGSGWTVISQPGVGGNYYLLYYFAYSGHNYNIMAYWEPQQGTFTTVSLPSGGVSTVYMIPKSCNGTCIL